MKKAELFEKMEEAKGKEDKMSNEWLTREVLRRVKYFEEYVMSGGDGFIEMLELMEWLKENDKTEVFNIDKIVKMLNKDVKDWFLGWMIINYCKK